LFTYLTQKKSRFILFVILSIFYSALTAVIALVLASIIEAATGDSMGVLIQVTLFASASIIVYTIMQYVYARVKNSILLDAKVQLKNDLFSSIMKKDVVAFETKNSAAYINDLTTNVNMVETLTFENIFQLINLTVSFTIAVAITVYFQPILLLIMIVLGFVSFFSTKITNKGIEDLSKAISDTAQQYQVGIKESFSGFKVIKSFQIINAIINIHNANNHLMEDKKIIHKMKMTFIGCSGMLVGFLSTVIIMAVAAGLSIRGFISIGAVFAVGHLMGQVTSPIHALPQIISNFKSARPICDELMELMKPSPVQKNIQRFDELKNAVEIKNVDFSYGDADVFKKTNLTIKRGKKYAVVGASGSGKTTLFSLLLGNYDNYKGNIQYDGKEIKEIEKDDIYNKIGVVYQDTFLFDDTLKNNITLYDNRFSEEEIMAAIYNAGLKEFVNNYPGLLDGQISENGKNISGGERQRINLARILLRKQNILFLDELSSSLDNEKAVEIETFLLSLKNITLLTITHRINKDLLTQYDSIITIKNKQLVVFESYEEAVKSGVI